MWKLFFCPPEGSWVLVNWEGGVGEDDITNAGRINRSSSCWHQSLISEYRLELRLYLISAQFVWGSFECWEHLDISPSCLLLHTTTLLICPPSLSFTIYPFTIPALSRIGHLHFSISFAANVKGTVANFKPTSFNKLVDSDWKKVKKKGSLFFSWKSVLRFIESPRIVSYWHNGSSIGNSISRRRFVVNK